MAKFTDNIAEGTRDLLVKAVGSTFWLSTTRVSSTITASSAIDITGVATGGELAVEDIILKTDQTTGLAGGTTFKVVCNNSKGTVTIMAVDITKLGAGVTVDIDTLNQNMTAPSDKLNRRTILENGKKLQIRNSTAVGTGAGTIDVYVKFRRLADGADIKVA